MPSWYICKSLPAPKLTLPLSGKLKLCAVCEPFVSEPLSRVNKRLVPLWYKSLAPSLLNCAITSLEPEVICILFPSVFNIKLPGPTSLT